MPNFEHYDEEARRIEQGIVRLGVALGIDWNDEMPVRQLARDALKCRIDPAHPDCLPITPENRVRLELFGLAQLMLKVMTQSAAEDIRTHGGPAWKAFGRALWIESGLG